MARVGNVTQNKTNFAWVLLPFALLLVMAVIMVSERAGVVYEIRYPPLHYLPQKSDQGNSEEELVNLSTLVLYDPTGEVGLEHFETICDVLDSMRVTYDVHDITTSRDYNLNNYEAVIVTFIDLDKAGAEILALVSWAERGGKLMFSIRPDPSDTFDVIYRKLGIISPGEEFVFPKGVTFTSDLLPGAKGMTLGLDFIEHSVFPYALEETANIVAVSGDNTSVPIIWEYDSGEGRVVVVNSDQFNSKADRGILGASYSLLFDAIIYPVINTSVYFVDDFPSPIPEGSYDLITEQYGRDIQGFYVNVWWPDIKDLSNRYGILYTGMFIETYSNQLEPPFEKQPEIERHQYFGGLLLDDGGELGFHGFNHIPLCLEKDENNSILGYPSWTSTENISLSLYELYTFAASLFPDYQFETYVPPSNILCDDIRTLLPSILPNLHVIAAVYLDSDEEIAYVQEFTEASDGIIEFPRIVSGFELDDYMRWAAINELGIHYVNSYFIHPDDVISEDRGALLGWEYLRSSFEEYINWLNETAPGLRNHTAREGAMAIQRFDRVQLTTEYQDDVTQVHIDNFYDEAWFMLRVKNTPVGISGGTLTKVSDHLYLIMATEAELEIYFSE